MHFIGELDSVDENYSVQASIIDRLCCFFYFCTFQLAARQLLFPLVHFYSDLANMVASDGL